MKTLALIATLFLAWDAPDYSPNGQVLVWATTNLNASWDARFSQTYTNVDDCWTVLTNVPSNVCVIPLDTTKPNRFYRVEAW
jgi:hypothetical protein